MKRREFIGLVGGTAAWPLFARAQQPSMPVIGYLSSRSAETDAAMLAAVRRGLGESGYIEGSNLAIEYRFANDDPARLPELASDLVHRQVRVIAAIASGLAARAAKDATVKHPREPHVVGVPCNTRNLKWPIDPRQTMV